MDKGGDLIWRSHELINDEPMKIFEFTEFSLNWIKGHLDHDVTQNPQHDDEFDLDGRRINAMGYLIDHSGNVVDVFGGNVVFKREILENKFGQDSEIPYVFRSGRLKLPEVDPLEQQLQRRNDFYVQRGKRRRMSESDDMDLDEDDVQRELDKIDRQDAVLSRAGQADVAAGRIAPGGVGALQSPEEQELLHEIEPDAEVSQSAAKQLSNFNVLDQ